MEPGGLGAESGLLDENPMWGRVSAWTAIGQAGSSSLNLT